MTTVIRKANGFTLVEVLVGMAILAIGLLGLASLQAVSLRSNASSQFRTQATNLAYSIVDAMRVNRTAALAGNYNTAIPTTLPGCPTSVVTLTGSIAQRDLAVWIDALACTLPQGTGSIARVGATVFTITVQWDDTRGQEDPQQFTMTTAL
jgi:type IV pilus assembly protein PilV